MQQMGSSLHHVKDKTDLQSSLQETVACYTIIQGPKTSVFPLIGDVT